MKINAVWRKSALACSMALLAGALMTVNPAYADTMNEEDLIKDINVPEAGVIQYDVTVPAGSTVNYKVELTPDKETGTIDKVSGVWKNTTNKAVTKTINAKVKFLSNEYTISATYTSNETQQKLEIKDKDTAVRSYETSTLHSSVKWDTGNAGDWKSIIHQKIKYLSEIIK